MTPRVVVRGLVKWATRVEQAIDQHQASGLAGQEAAANWAARLEMELALSGNRQPQEVCIALDADEAKSLVAALRAGQHCIETLVFGPTA